MAHFRYRIPYANFKLRFAFTSFVYKFGQNLFGQPPKMIISNTKYLLYNRYCAKCFNRHKNIILTCVLERETWRGSVTCRKWNRQNSLKPNTPPTLLRYSIKKQKGKSASLKVGLFINHQLFPLALGSVWWGAVQRHMCGFLRVEITAGMMMKRWNPADWESHFGSTTCWLYDCEHVS